MATIVLDQVSRWFGNVVAVNDVTMTIGPGVTGLLGPNGAGKSTILNMIGGFLAPSAGTVTLDGEPTWHNEAIYRRIGLVPEREAMYDVVTGRRFLIANAELHSLDDPEAAAARALETVDMLDAQDRPIETYSKGMKQRIKIATALVHDPDVLLLDEPFNGMDPRQRLHLMELLTRMGADGRTVLFSSHILEEVEQIADRIQVLVAGRHAAAGDHREIRRLMTERPHRYRIRSDDDRALAAALVADPSTTGVELVPGGEVLVSTTSTTDAGPAAASPTATAPAAAASAALPPTTLHVQASDFASFVRVLPQVATRHGIRLYEVTPADESLESVFSYLVER